MKRLLIGILCLFVVSTPVMFTGCATTNSAAVKYLTLKDTQIAVDKAMKLYGEQCALGKVSVEQQAKADKAYDQYRQAMRLAIQAAKLNLSAITPSDVEALSVELLTLLSRL